MNSKTYDVLIIGGGPAGLSIATTLARQVYSALVLDSGVYRNAVAKHMHSVPGFDHVDPADFRAKVKADLQARYASIDFASATVKEVRKLESGIFQAVDERGTVYRGKKLGLATGARDMLEKEADGYTECWGRGIFHCFFCHGYEERGVESAGALGMGLANTPEALNIMCRSIERLSHHVTVYTNGNSDLAVCTEAITHSNNITYDDRIISKFQLGNNGAGPSVIITFSDGTSKTEGFIAGQPIVELCGAELIKQLELKLTPEGDVAVSAPFNETSVSGCFAAGDATTQKRTVMQALYTGTFAGAGLALQAMQELDALDKTD